MSEENKQTEVTESAETIDTVKTTETAAGPKQVVEKKIVGM